MVQWLRLHAPNAGGLGSVPGQGTRSCMLQLRACMPQVKIPLASTEDLTCGTKDPACCNEDLAGGNEDPACHK